MNRLHTVFLPTLLSLFFATLAQAGRSACTATYDTTAGTINISAVDVGSNRYVVKLTSITTGTSPRFKLSTATLTTNHDCYDAASVSNSVLSIPDLAVADSFYAATLTLVAGNGPSQIDLATSSPSTMQFDITSASKNPRLVPDSGFRVSGASNPFATVNSSTGITYLGYQSNNGSPPAFQSSSNGLSFSSPTTLTYNNRSVDSRRTLMPDGKTWRLYQTSGQQGPFTSYVSTDGNVFTAETGTRYSAQTTDNGTLGVYDLYTAPDGALILVYLGDLMGKNNLRMAKSIDNGVTFTFVKGNVLGDDDGTNGQFVDNKVIRLADGRYRMFTMRTAELQSFISSDGYNWTREPGTRINYTDYATVGVTIYSLNDPVSVLDNTSKLKVYVSAETSVLSATNPVPSSAIVSATWNENVGSGVLTATAANSINFKAGWNLVGNGVEAPIAVATTFNDATKVTTIWKWVTSGSTSGVTYPAWAFYSPSHSDGGKAYAASNGYEFLIAINGGEGFWVNAKTAFNTTLPSGLAVQSSSFKPTVVSSAAAAGRNALPRGWSLIAAGDAATPAQFDASIATTLSTSPAAGKVYTNLSSLWAWDATQAKWYFWAPSLINDGTSASYISSKNYLDFATLSSSPSGTLSPSTGFWVNIP